MAYTQGPNNNLLALQQAAIQGAVASSNGVTWCGQTNQFTTSNVRYQVGNTVLANPQAQMVLSRDCTIFYAGDPGVEILRITPEGLKYKGELINDAGEAHRVMMKTFAEIWKTQL